MIKRLKQNMKVKKYTEVKLNPKDEKLVFTILDLAGWYKGRSVDIEEVDINPRKHDIIKL